MRVALVSDWFAPRRGGIESQLERLADGLAAAGHSVEVVTSTPGAVDGGRFQTRPLRVATLPRLDLAVSPKLFDALRAELLRGHDVVHAHVSIVSPVGYAGAFVARSLALPTVVTFHSVLTRTVALLAAANALAGMSASPVVWTAVSDLVADQVRRALRGADVQVLPNGLDLGFWRDAPPSPGAARDTRITLVSAMRLHRKKRPRELVRGFARAAARAGVPARLVIAGEGPERSALEREIAELGLAPEDAPAIVELVGWQTPEHLRALYASADGFVVASRHEAFGIAALEARAAGLPVVAMTSSGSSAFLRDRVDSLLCADDAALAGTLALFLRDGDLRDRLRRAAPRLDRFAWAAVLAAHERVYEIAMRRSAAARTAEA